MTTRFTQDPRTPEAAEDGEEEEETSIAMDQVAEVWIESSTKDQQVADQSQDTEDHARRGAQDHTQTAHPEATMTSM